MVTLGFIVEGATEKIILEKSDFFRHLDTFGIAYISEVIDASGHGNLLPHNILPFTNVLTDKGATHIFILTDLDARTSILQAKENLKPQHNHIITFSIKAVEAWFLSDTEAMRRYLGDPSFSYEHPELTDNPFEEIKSIRKAITGKGISDKKVLANSIVRKHGFSILNAAKHPKCSSARYFLKKIGQITTAN